MNKLNAADRRDNIMRILFRRGFETVPNLANELHVSERTILRDISLLILTEPIDTKTGRYGGGVYVIEGANSRRLYMKDEETKFFYDFISDLEARSNECFSEDKIQSLKNLVSLYEKPKRKER